MTTPKTLTIEQIAGICHEAAREYRRILNPDSQPIASWAYASRYEREVMVDKVSEYLELGTPDFTIPCEESVIAGIVNALSDTVQPSTDSGETIKLGDVRGLRRLHI